MGFVDKEMSKNAIAFYMHENVGKCIPATAPRSYRKMIVQIIFDIN